MSSSSPGGAGLRGEEGERESEREREREREREMERKREDLRCGGDKAKGICKNKENFLIFPGGVPNPSPPSLRYQPQWWMRKTPLQSTNTGLSNMYVYIRGCLGHIGGMLFACSVLQCVAVCCSVLQCISVCCNVLHRLWVT